MTREFSMIVESFMVTTTFVINLVIIIFMLIDSKQKKAIDWLIAVITFFSAEVGVVLFLLWQFYKGRVQIQVGSAGNLTC